MSREVSVDFPSGVAVGSVSVALPWGCGRGWVRLALTAVVLCEVGMAAPGGGWSL